MTIQIQSIHFSADQKLVSFINKKLFKIISIDDNIVNTDVYLKIEKSSNHNNKTTEIKIHSSLCHYFAKKTSDSFEESVDLATQAIRKQVLKQKSK